MGQVQIEGLEGQITATIVNTLWARVQTSTNAPYWPIPTRNATLDDEEAQGKMGFALNLLTKLTQVSHHTDCHAGNPCELVNDPRVKICDPIIEEIQGPLLAGACFIVTPPEMGCNGNMELKRSVTFIDNSARSEITTLYGVVIKIDTWL
ncbi:hypothetical protein Tco_1403498 [Tanacetum coccineum]